MRDSVTVSIAAERIGMSSASSRVRKLRVETWLGRMSLRDGMRRTSSKASPSVPNFSSGVTPPPSPAQVYRAGPGELAGLRRSGGRAGDAHVADGVGGRQVRAVLAARDEPADRVARDHAEGGGIRVVPGVDRGAPGTRGHVRPVDGVPGDTG